MAELTDFKDVLKLNFKYHDKEGIYTYGIIL